jgi:hypothetical protein
MSNYPDLVSLLQGGPQAFDNTAGAALEAIQVVDQQVAAISYAQINGGFPGAGQMAQAVQRMQVAAAPWPQIKSGILQAAAKAVAAGPVAAALGNTDTTAAQLLNDMQVFAASELDPVVAGFAAATAAFNDFQIGMAQSYAFSADANQAAANAVAASQQQINDAIAMLQAREQNLSSAGSIITGIFSFGISYAVELRQLQEEAAQLGDQENQQQFMLRSYQASLGTFNNALNATKVASYALLTLSTSLQQAGNGLDDVTRSSSPNLQVMQAFLQQFKSEFALAVAKIQTLSP